MERRPHTAKHPIRALVLVLGLFAVAHAQTPPIQPQTPDVKIPPKLTLPAPNEVVIGSQPLTADEAVAIALQHQPDVAIARANIEISRGRVRQSQSDLLPNFTLGAGFSDSRTFRGTGGGTLNRFSSSLTVDQLLFDFGRTRDSLRQQQALSLASIHNLSRTQQTLAGDVKVAFYNLCEDLANVSNSEQNVANRQRQLDQAQARLDSGLGAPSDVVQAKTGLADAAISLSNARSTALDSQVILARLLGIDPRTPITPAESAENPLPSENDLQALVESALNARPDVLAAREQVKAAGFAVSVARKGNLPRITASAGLGGRGPNDPFDTQTGSFSVNLSWNFADSGFTAGAVQSAKGSQEVAQQNLIAVGQQVVSEISQDFTDLQSALQRVDLAQVAVANAQEQVRIAEGRFTGGIGTFLEVTSAQSALYSAQRSQTAAQQDVQRIRARLREDTGT